MAGQVVSAVLARAGAARRQRAAHPVPARRRPASSRAAPPSPSTSARRWSTVPEYRSRGPGWSADDPVGGSPSRPVRRPAGEDRRVPVAPRLPSPVTGPEVVAHRGATAEAPEHTLAAYRRAADDRRRRRRVRRAHDPRRRPRLRARPADRTARPTAAASSRRCSLDELEQFHFGARRRVRAQPVGRRRDHRGDRRARRRERPGPHPRPAARATSPPRPGTVRLAIETKHPTRHTRKVEEALVGSPRAVRAARATARPVEWAGKPAVRMMSFSQLAVRRMADLAPGIPTVQLIGKRLRPVRRELLLGSATAVGPGIALLRADPDFVADAHAAGKEVHVWTVNRRRRHGPRARPRRRRHHHRPSRRAAPPARARGVRPPSVLPARGILRGVTLEDLVRLRRARDQMDRDYAQPLDVPAWRAPPSCPPATSPAASAPPTGRRPTAI